MRAALAAVFLGVALTFGVAGCAGSSSTSAPGPTSTRAGSRAQPVARVDQIEQGDPCDVNGATAFNQQGRPFDCEPWVDGVKRWVLP